MAGVPLSIPEEDWNDGGDGVHRDRKFRPVLTSAMRPKETKSINHFHASFRKIPTASYRKRLLGI